MCGRYALAADPDELPLQFWRQYDPDYQPHTQDNHFPSNDEQHSTGQPPEEAPSDEEDASGFRMASELPSGSVGGLSEVGRGAGGGGAGLGRSEAGEASGAGGKSQPPIDWASEQAKRSYRKRYNVAPSTRCPVVRRGPSGKLVVDSLHWGIIPNWSKDMSGLHPINARDDGIKSGSGMWSGLRGKKRCVVIMDGWYEWTQKGNKVPYYTKHKENKLVIMAGLWDSAMIPASNGQPAAEIESFTIATTHANKQLNFLHGRMPVILDNKADLDLWLSAEGWGPKLEKLLKPYDKKLECYQVPPEVGKVQNESADFIKPVAARKGGIASMFATQAAKSSPHADSPLDLSKPALQMTSPTAERKPKHKAEAKVPLPSKIDTFFGKAGTPAKPQKRKAEPKSDDGSSEVEIIESSPAKKAKLAVKHDTKSGEEEVEVLTKKDDGEVEVEERGVQDIANPA